MINLINGEPEKFKLLARHKHKAGIESDPRRTLAVFCVQDLYKLHSKGVSEERGKDLVTIAFSEYLALNKEALLLRGAIAESTAHAVVSLLSLITENTVIAEAWISTGLRVLRTSVYSGNGSTVWSIRSGVGVSQKALALGRISANLINAQSLDLRKEILACAKCLAYFSDSYLYGLGTEVEAFCLKNNDKRIGELLADLEDLDIKAGLIRELENRWYQHMFDHEAAGNPLDKGLEDYVVKVLGTEEKQRYANMATKDAKELDN